MTGKLKLTAWCFRVCLLTFIVWSGNAEAEWAMSGSGGVAIGKSTTISLEWKAADKSAPGGDGLLWLDVADHENAIIPETVSHQNGKAQFSAFFRDKASELLVYDAGRKTVTTVPLTFTGMGKYHPRITVPGYRGLSIVYANQVVTPTLTLVGGVASGAESALLSLRDHRGKVVVSRFSNTFDLQGGLDELRVPAAGLYELRAEFYKEPKTSMPLALQRDPQLIAFGMTVAQLPEMNEVDDLVTTAVIGGSRVSLEHAPTTATLVAEDRLKLYVFASHSNEKTLNRWPYVIMGAHIEDVPTALQAEVARRILPWFWTLGTSFSPVTFQWSDLQTGPQDFRWIKFLSVLPLYQQHRLAPLLTIDGTALWNGEYPSDSAETEQAWSNLITEISNRYRSKIWSLQPWNQPESIWTGDKGAAAYREVFKSTWKAFLNPGKEVFKAPPVILGGTDGFNQTFFESALTSETSTIAGGIGFSLYPGDPANSPEDNGFVENLNKASNLLKAKGANNTKIWVTGCGWPNSPGGVGEKLQANYLVRSHVIALAHNAYKVYWNGITDKVKYAWEGSAEDRMGLMRADLTPKPSAMAYNFLGFIASGITAKGVEKQGKATVYSFDIPLQTNKWRGVLYVAWTGSPNDRQDIKLEMSHGGGVFAMDYLGAEIPALNMDENADNALVGTFQVPVGFEPVFIWDAGKP